MNCLIWRTDSRLNRRRWRQLLEGADVIHLQGLFFDQAHFHLLGDRITTPLVVSLWGSDVLREHNPEIIALQRQILQKAALVTGTSQQFRDYATRRFGSFLKPKLRETYFSADDTVIEGVTAGDRSEASRRFRQRHSIDHSAVIVTIGHNGHRPNQHIEVIGKIASLDQELQNRLHIIVPATYGLDQGYHDQLKVCLAKCGIPHKVLVEDMTPTEIVDLRLATDIQIFVPISDSFSATVSQAIGAGSIVVCGDWLPYQARRDAGLYFHEIASLDVLPDRLAHILGNFEASLAKCQPNRDITKSFFDPARLGNQWIETYQEAVELHNKTNI